MTQIIIDNFSTILFDFDNTIIDTTIYANMYPAVLHNIFANTQLTEDTLDFYASEPDIFKNESGRYDSSELCAKLDCLDAYYAILFEHIEVVDSLHPQVKPLLAYLNQKQKTIGIVTNSMRRTLKLYLEKYNLHDFAFLYTRDEAGCKKKSPQYWGTLIQLHNIEPQNTLIVGDSEFDDKLCPGKFGFTSFIIQSPNDLRKLGK
jgi:HAD superfamily hydrolase (TIGR01549 family)